MAHDPGPCGPQFEDWEAAYAKYEAKSNAADVAIRRAAAASAVAAGVCGAGWWTGGGTAACIAAAATALYLDGESIAASNARNAAAALSQAAKTAYENCVEAHKHFYG